MSLEGWFKKAIKDLAKNEKNSFIDGDWVEAPYITNEGIRLIQTGNVGIGQFIDNNKKYISETSFIELGCKEVYGGDILICRLADPIGRSCIVPELENKAITSVDVCILRVDEEKYDKDFVAHSLNQQSFLDICQKASGGSTRQRISRTNLGQITINLPKNRQEQEKIAEVLSTVDRAIAQTEALIAKQQRIKTGLMQDLLTKGIDEQGNIRSEETHEFKDSPLGRIPVEWDTHPLHTVVDLNVGYAFKSSWFAEEGVKLLRGENVGYGLPDWDDTKYLPKDKSNGFNEYLLAEGDLIIGMDRTFTKSGFKVSEISKEDLPCLLVQRVGRFIPYNINHDYMKMVIQSSLYRDELLSLQKGMDIPHLSRSEILSPLIPIPKNKNEMNAISSQYHLLDQSIKNNYHHLEKLSSIKTGLMQDLLNGKVPVTPLLKD